ncbi:hypothetical protein HDU96_007531 [Phlyctochytrium bullatum]|nr:hypothetical protein HDU96_007531 [Phlyctochytrium bullatum]
MKRKATFSVFEVIRASWIDVNSISIVENLDHLHNLRFITLADNKITCITGVKGLTKLKFMDLARNRIVNFDVVENPVCLSPDYRLQTIVKLPNLYELDEVKVSKTERALANNVLQPARCVLV